MLIGFLDETSLVVDEEDKQPDIFVFGGYFIPINQLHDFQKRIQEVKQHYNLFPHAPIKWNLRDDSLQAFYVQERWLNPDWPEQLLPHATTIRRDLLALLGEFDARILISARYDKHWQKVKQGQYYQWAFENLLQRVGLMANGLRTQDCVDGSTMIVVDWPPQELNKNLFDIYMGGYYFGTGFDSHSRQYHSGPIKQYRFLDSITHGSTLHSAPLQMADMVVGCCRDFLSWAYKGTRPNKIRGLFDLLIDHFYTGANGQFDGYGFKVAKDERIDLEAKIAEYRAWSQQSEINEQPR